MSSNGHAASIIVVMPDPETGLLGVPIVKDPMYENPLMKFPGGKGKNEESASETASRELFEEIGILIPPKEFTTSKTIGQEQQRERSKYIGVGEDKKFVKTVYHMYWPYYHLLPTYQELLTVGNEGEKVYFLHLVDIPKLEDYFLNTHYEIFKQFCEYKMSEIANFYPRECFDNTNHSNDCAYLLWSLQ